MIHFDYRTTSNGDDALFLHTDDGIELEFLFLSNDNGNVSEIYLDGGDVVFTAYADANRGIFFMVDRQMTSLEILTINAYLAYPIIKANIAKAEKEEAAHVRELSAADYSETH